MPVVVIKHVAAVTSDVEVGSAVVVVVAHGHSHVVTAIAEEARWAGHVREHPLAVVVEQAVGEAGPLLLRADARRHGVFQLGAVGEEDVQPSIAVVVENGDAAAHGLDQVLLRGRRALVNKDDPALARDVGEAKRLRSLGCHLRGEAREPHETGGHPGRAAHRASARSRRSS